MIFKRLVAAALFALLPVTAEASQATVTMPTSGPMSLGTFVTSYLNPALAALLGCNSGSTAPAVSGQPVAYECWVDTSGSPKLLKIYDGASWLTLGSIDTAAHTWTPAGALLSSAIGSTVQAYSAALTSWAAITRASGFDTFAATATSANLSSLITDETGTGSAVFSSAIREKLTTNRTYYVGANIPTPSISIGSPAVVTSTAHGLSAGDPLVFNVPLNTTSSTISAANPAVVTMANSFAAGQPVKFSSSGSLPYGVVPGTTYYVISAGLSGTQFEFSATVGGSAVDTTPPTAGFTNGSANITITNANTYYSVGQTIRFANSGGALPTNFAAATDYFILSATSTLITVSATNGGSAIVAGSAGTGTQTALQSGSHFTSSTGALPTGITEGTTYYVSTASLATNSFTLADTSAHALAGTGAINTSGSVTGSPIYGAYTGNDANTGLAQTRAGALLTLNKARDAIMAIDLGGFTATIQAASARTFTAGLSFVAPPVGGNVTLDLGGSTLTTNGNAVTNSAPFNLTVQNGKISTTSGNALLANVPGAKITLGAGLEFGPTAARQVRATGLAYVIATASFTVSGATTAVISADAGAQVAVNGSLSITLVGNPAISTGFADATVGGIIYAGSVSFPGSNTGPRFNFSGGGIIYTNGGGASYFPGSSAGVGTSGTSGFYV